MSLVSLQVSGLFSLEQSKAARWMARSSSCRGQEGCSSTAKAGLARIPSRIVCVARVNFISAFWAEGLLPNKRAASSSAIPEVIK